MDLLIPVELKLRLPGEGLGVLYLVADEVGNNILGVHLDRTDCGDLRTHVTGEVALDHSDIAEKSVLLPLIVLLHRVFVVLCHLVERILRL